jgi:hypothetical protein
VRARVQRVVVVDMQQADVLSVFWRDRGLIFFSRKGSTFRAADRSSHYGPLATS